MSPAGFVTSFTRHGDFDDVYASFHEWERWCADVFDTHTAYPMLLLFRSRQVGRSWLAGLTIVVEAAAYTMAVLDREPRREAELLYRRAVVLLATLVANPDPADRALDRMGPVDRSMVLPTEASFRVSYERLVAAGLPCRPFDDAWSGVQALRELYVPHLEVLARVFLVPPVFRTHAPPIPTLPAPRTG